MGNILMKRKQDNSPTKINEPGSQNIKENYVPIKHISFSKIPRKCSICNGYIYCDDEHLHNNYLLFYPFIGWFFCDNCIDSGLAKCNVIEWIKRDNMIPCNWMFASNTFKMKHSNLERHVKFNVLNTIKQGIIFDYNENKAFRYNHNKKIMEICLEYRDDATVIKYNIDLSNIIKHTDKFYEKLISCKNIMKHPKIIISFDELPYFVRSEVARSKY